MESLYTKINAFDDIVFIGGSDQILIFQIADESGIPIDLTSASFLGWSMAYFGNPDKEVLALSATIGTSTDEMVVTIPGSSTRTLYGKFIHQPIIRDLNGTEFRPSQGVITISPRIGNPLLDIQVY